MLGYMNRRSFLRSLMYATPAIAIGTELAELLSPRRTIFLPPATGWAVRQEYGYYYHRELEGILKMDIQPIVRIRNGPSIPGMTWNVYESTSPWLE